MKWVATGGAGSVVALLLLAAGCGAAVNDNGSLGYAIGDAVGGAIGLCLFVVVLAFVVIAGVLIGEKVSGGGAKWETPDLPPPPAPVTRVEHHAWMLVVNTEHGRRALKANSPEGLKRLVNELPERQRREVLGSTQWRELNP